MRAHVNERTDGRLCLSAVREPRPPTTPPDWLAVFTGPEPPGQGPRGRGVAGFPTCPGRARLFRAVSAGWGRRVGLGRSRGNRVPSRGPRLRCRAPVPDGRFVPAAGPPLDSIVPGALRSIFFGWSSPKVLSSTSSRSRPSPARLCKAQKTLPGFDFLEGTCSCFRTPAHRVSFMLWFRDTSVARQMRLSGARFVKLESTH